MRRILKPNCDDALCKRSPRNDGAVVFMKRDEPPKSSLAQTLLPRIDEERRREKPARGKIECEQEQAEKRRRHLESLRNSIAGIRQQTPVILLATTGLGKVLVCTVAANSMSIVLVAGPCREPLLSVVRAGDQFFLSNADGCYSCSAVDLVRFHSCRRFYAGRDSCGPLPDHRAFGTRRYGRGLPRR